MFEEIKEEYEEAQKELKRMNNSIDESYNLLKENHQYVRKTNRNIREVEKKKQPISHFKHGAKPRTKREVWQDKKTADQAFLDCRKGDLRKNGDQIFGSIQAKKQTRKLLKKEISDLDNAQVWLDAIRVEKPKKPKRKKSSFERSIPWSSRPGQSKKGRL